VSRGILKRLFQSEDTSELHSRLDAIEKRMRSVEEDWTEVYNKFRTLQMRVAKQVQRLDANSSQEEPQGAEGDESVDLTTPTISSLSPRQQKLQREIMLRRRAATPGGE
jgi:tetrahydromethanopterin S-methyltransferase subunit G